METKKDTSLDIAKGIGILLMVIGHTGCPKWLHDSIYSFHMPLFFILSGICLSEKRLKNSYKDYAYSRIKRLYLPFIKYGLFFYTFNLIINISIYDRSISIIGSLKDLGLIFAMIQTPDLVAGYWFLTALFFASILGFILLKIVRNKICKLLLIPLLLVLMIVFQKYGIHFLELFSYKTVYYTALFLGGYLYKKQICEMAFKCRSFCAVFFLLICTLVTSLCNLHTATDSPYEILLVFCLSVFGSIGTIWICKDIAKYTKCLSKGLKYLGEKTMDILTWHFSGLRIMNVLIVVCFALPKDQIMAFPCIQDNSYNWCIYVPFAIGFSLLMGEMIKSVKNDIQYCNTHI